MVAVEIKMHYGTKSSTEEVCTEPDSENKKVTLHYIVFIRFSNNMRLKKRIRNFFRKFNCSCASRKKQHKEIYCLWEVEGKYKLYYYFLD